MFETRIRTHGHRCARAERREQKIKWVRTGVVAVVFDWLITDDGVRSDLNDLPELAFARSHRGRSHDSHGPRLKHRLASPGIDWRLRHSRKKWPNPKAKLEQSTS